MKRLCFVILFAFTLGACEAAPTPSLNAITPTFVTPTLTTTTTAITPTLSATQRALPTVSAFTPPPTTPTPTPTPKPRELREKLRRELPARLQQYFTQLGLANIRLIPKRIQDANANPSDCLVEADTVIAQQVSSDIPIILVSIHSDDVCSGMLIFWYDSEWRYQTFEPRQNTYDPSFLVAKLVTAEGRKELGVAWDCLYCSVIHLEYSLLRLDGEHWTIVWQPKPQEWRGVHGSIEFADGLNRLTVHYSDWSPPDNKFAPDGKSIFAASNAGPHRWFEDTWQRTGDSYHLVETVFLPSVYKTTVEFFYALIARDDKSAAKWTTDSSLVRRARELGLDRMPSPRWADDDDKAGTVKIWRNETPQAAIPRMNPWVILRMTKRGDEWLITAIEPIQ